MNIQTINGIKNNKPVGGIFSWTKSKVDQAVDWAKEQAAKTKTTVQNVTSGNSKITIKEMLNTFGKYGANTTHIIFAVPLAVSRSAFRGLMNTNAFGLASVLHLLFEKQPDKREQFKKIWYRSGGEADASTVLADIRKGSEKGIPANFSTKKIKEIAAIKSDSQTISGHKTIGIGEPVSTAVIASAPIPIMVQISGLLTAAAGLWGTLKGNNQQTSDPLNHENNSEGDQLNKDSVINPLIILGVLGAGAYFIFKKKDEK